MKLGSERLVASRDVLDAGLARERLGLWRYTHQDYNAASGFIPWVSGLSTRSLLSQEFADFFFLALIANEDVNLVVSIMVLLQWQSHRFFWSNKCSSFGSLTDKILNETRGVKDFVASRDVLDAGLARERLWLLVCINEVHWVVTNNANVGVILIQDYNAASGFSTVVSGLFLRGPCYRRNSLTSFSSLLLANEDVNLVVSINGVVAMAIPIRFFLV
ncbi:hypothetical protein FQR65_LT19550 [Abscondita terminalis]|nr:hypothetical protein FQR65_LT19550 [Abscondita terminalis]